MPVSELELETYSTTHSVAEATSGLPTPRSGASSEADLAGVRDDQPPANKEAFDSYPDGGLQARGVFQDELVRTGLAPSSTLAWIGSVQASLEALLAIPCSRLVAAYGPRRVALAGTVLAAAGPILAGSCTHSVPGLLITEGAMFGLGQALCFFASATLPSAYFLRRRNMATGFVYAGAGVGGALFSIIAAQLLQRLSLAWTFRTIGFIFLALNLPASLALKARAAKEPLLSGKKVLDWSLFKDIRFTLLLIGTAIALFPLFVPPFFLPLYGTSLGLSASTSSLLLAGFNLASAGGRIGFGLFADSLLGSLNSLVLCLALVGVSTLVIWPLATSLTPLIVFSVFNGLCAGGMFSLIPGTLSSVFGTRDLSLFFSMLVSAWTPGYALGSPIAGMLLQAYGGPDAGYGAYRPAIFYSGGLSLAAAGFVLAVRLIQDRRLWKKIADIELESVGSRTQTDSIAPIAPADSLAASAKDDQPPANREAFDSYPDGGREAWLQVVACFVLFTTTSGGIYSCKSRGVFQDALVQRGVAPSSTLIWVGSVQASLQAICAILCQRLVAAFGPRRVALAGTFFASAGPIAASFCLNSVPGLIFTEGLCFGMGQALVFFASATLPSAYFLQRRNIATGLTYAGAGAGGAVFSIVAAQLVEHLSLPWTFRTIGFIFLALNFPASLVLRARAAREPFIPKKKLFDRTLYKDIRFTLLLLGTAIAVFPLFVPPFFIPLYGTSVGLSTSTSSLLLAAFNLASAGGRIGFGVFADSLLGSLNSLVLCLALVAVSTLVIWSVATTVAPLVAFVVINGLCAGGMFSLIPGTLSSLFGSQNLGLMFSMLLSHWTLGYFFGTPIAGYLLQAQGGPEAGYLAYRPAIFYSGGLSTVAALLVLAVRLIQDRRLLKKI
ncbi:hypothetical protein JCM10207_008667 [Rhodosporidiobolus poonsookiae]